MKIYLIGFICFLLNTTLFSQYSAYKNVQPLSINNYKSNTYNNYFRLKDTISKTIIKRSYFDCGQIKSEFIIDSKSSNKFNGKQTYWYKSGAIQSKINYRLGVKDGLFKTFWENGNTKREDRYKNGKFIKGHCWNKLGKKVKYYPFYIPPQFKGGSNGLATYLKKNIVYPKNSNSSSSSNKVVVCAFISNSGKIKNAKIIKGVNKILNKEAKRVIMKMPNWSPARKDGIAISSEISIPILFLRN